MADYRDRLRAVITLISPSGIEFTAKWRGNPVTLTNNVDVRKSPGVAGARVRDLRVDAKEWPLTIYFDGPDNDLDATKYMDALRDESGPWRVEHPVKGTLFLTHAISVEHVLPVTSGGITKVESSWIEGLPESEDENAALLQADATAQADDANASAADQFGDNAKQDPASAKQSLISSVGSAITGMRQQLSAIENAELIDAEFLAIATAIQNTLTQPLINTSLLAGQIQNIVQIFGVGQTSAEQGVDMYATFAESVVADIAPTQANVEGLSTIAVAELTASAAMTAAGQMSLIGGSANKGEALAAAARLNEMLNNVSAGLDATQTLYVDQPIDQTYFSQSKSYSETVLMNALSTKFLLSSLQGLPSERRFILKQNKFTAQVAFEEYKRLGEDLETVMFLIDTNGLRGDEIYILNAGREVVIFQ